MSKAFTKEDDDAGFTAPSSSSIVAASGEPFHLTATGARRARASSDTRVKEALAIAHVLEPVRVAERAALGVTVRVREGERELAYRLVSPAERALLGDGCSVDGPIGRALLGAEVGDVREVTLPRGRVELEVVALDGEARETNP